MPGFSDKCHSGTLSESFLILLANESGFRISKPSRESKWAQFLFSQRNPAMKANFSAMYVGHFSVN